MNTPFPPFAIHEDCAASLTLSLLTDQEPSLRDINPTLYTSTEGCLKHNFPVVLMYRGPSETLTDLYLPLEVVRALIPQIAAIRHEASLCDRIIEFTSCLDHQKHRFRLSRQAWTSFADFFETYLPTLEYNHTRRAYRDRETHRPTRETSPFMVEDRFTPHYAHDDPPTVPLGDVDPAVLLAAHYNFNFAQRRQIAQDPKSAMPPLEAAYILRELKERGHPQDISVIHATLVDFRIAQEHGTEVLHRPTYWRFQSIPVTAVVTLAKQGMWTPTTDTQLFIDACIDASLAFKREAAQKGQTPTGAAMMAVAEQAARTHLTPQRLDSIRAAQASILDAALTFRKNDGTPIEVIPDDGQPETEPIFLPAMTPAALRRSFTVVGKNAPKP